MAKNRSNSFNDEIKEVWDEGKDKTEQMASEIKEGAGELWGRTRKKVKDSAAHANEFADEHPWQMAAIGAAVGFIVATLLFKRRD